MQVRSEITAFCFLRIFSNSVQPFTFFITRTLVSFGYLVVIILTKFDLCEFRRLFKDPMKDFLAVSLVFVF